jgi:hypothetical protein
VNLLRRPGAGHDASEPPGRPTEREIDALALAAADAVDADQVLRLARELVRIRSVWDEATGTDEEAAAGFVARSLRDLGLPVHVEEVAPGRPNVIADWHGRGFVAGRDRTLMFEGHTDVVTEGDPASWTRDPYGAGLEADLAEEFDCHAAGFPGGDGPCDAGRFRDEVPDGQTRVEAREGVLEDHLGVGPNRAQRSSGKAGDSMALQPHLALAGFDQSQDGAGERGLAAS